ncbi:type II secretion system F family protein [Streptantibioticus rubrisoli]|uniref:Type II secretion system F family protein n=1 Tax=Streptantibioticus rubrisoli TaxID=1387313 RepID=A0ABT1PLB3_9ACTN|nr:type II secretion system F family protein [Streptantibioticus rubrisoli]MCQ4045586.1 type II secretion system F family protein [Streptantibioticus rubrisoli]
MRDAELLTVWCAAVCAAGAVWRLHRQDEAVRRARLMLAGGGRAEAVPQVGPRWRALCDRAREALRRGRARAEHRLGFRFGHEVWCPVAGTVLALLAHSPVPALVAALATPYVRRVLRVRARRRTAERWQEVVVGLCVTVAGDLRAGRPPDAALVEAVEGLRGPDGPDGAEGVTPVLAAARFGGDVPGALRQAAARPGAQGLAGVAACWEVSVDGGAGLADGLDRVAAALRAERDQREDLRAQLAGPRSTAVMLALLPVFGVVLGATLGADPLRVLLRTPTGLGCLLVGGALEWAGLAWTARIVGAAQEAT